MEKQYFEIDSSFASLVILFFILGIMVKLFKEKLSNKHSIDNNSSNIKKTDNKMLFIINTDEKLKPNYISKQTAQLSKDTYKKNILEGSVIQKEIVEYWNIYGCKKITLKIKSENECKAEELFDKIINEINKVNIKFTFNEDKNVLAIGPYYSSVLDSITGKLKLLS